MKLLSDHMDNMTALLVKYSTNQQRSKAFKNKPTF